MLADDKAAQQAALPRVAALSDQVTAMQAQLAHLDSCTAKNPPWPSLLHPHPAGLVRTLLQLGISH